MANFRLVAFNQKGQLVPPASGDIGLVELLAVGTEQSYAVLTKTNLDSLLSLINSQDASALHHHDSIYFTKSELTSVNPANTGASKIIAGNPYGGYASVQTVLDTLYSDVSSLGSLVFEWQNSVVTTSLLAPPLSPLMGDRYLLGLSLASLPSDDWAGFGGHIAEWTGTEWKKTAPSTGMFISADDNPQVVYYFSGSDWSEKTFENNTGSGFIDITGGVVSLKNLSEKRIIVGDESNIATAVDTATLGQIEASVDGLIVKELALFGGGIEYPQGSGLFPDNIADFSITHSKLDDDQPGRLLGFNQNTNAVAVDIVGDVTFTVSANQQMTTSIQPLAVKSGMVDWGSETNQIDDTDIPANNTPVNYTGGATLRAELEGIDSAIGSLQQQNSLQNAEDLTFLKLDGSRAMSGALDMGNQTITNAAEIQVANIKDQVNNAAIDLVQADALRVARKIIFTGGTKKIENLADGTVSTDAANFGQLSAVQTFLISEIAKKLDKAGDTMSGALDMGGNLVRNIADGVLAKDAINLSQLQSSVTQLQNADTANLQTAKNYTDAQVLIEKTRAETAESQLSTSIAQETANRQVAITAEANTRAAEDLTFVKLDGSRVMTGSLSFGGTKKIVQLSNGQDPLDAVNKSQLDAVNTNLTNSINAEISARTSADTALSDRLVVLEADPVTKAYVNTADANLQTQLNNAVSTINTSITALQQQDQTLAASVQTEQAARIAADSALSTRIDTEVSTRQSQDALLSQRIAVLEVDPVTKTYVDTQDTNLQNQITTLNTRVTTEITRVDASIATLSQTVTSNYNGQQLANQNLQAQITQEVADRVALGQRVTTAETDISALEQGLSTAQSDIVSLETRASSSENNIQQLQTNVSTLQTQVAANTNSISTINTSLVTVNSTLDLHNTRLNTLEADPVTKTYVDSKDLVTNNRIDFIISNTDAAALNSLSEIVSAFQTADNNINNAITTLANAAATNLQTEVDRATAAENQLRADLSSETTARQNADQLINARIDGVDTSIASLESDTTTLAGNLNSLTATVTGLQTSFANAISDLETEITSLNSRTTATETLVSQLGTDVATVTGNLNNLSSSVTTSLSQINTSITNIQTEVTQLDLDLQAEINRATFAESGLDARVSNLENAPQPVLSVNQKLPGVNGSVLISTDDVPEGAINRYYSSVLFSSDFSLKSTSDLQEGINLYYTQSRFDSALSQKTTTDVVEGSNLYFTNTRVNNATLESLDGSVSGGIAVGDTLIVAFSKFVKQVANLQIEIDAEETRAIAAENNLQSQIAALAAEVQALADQVGEDLQQVLTDLTNAITLEQQARISADTAADTRITFLENNYVSQTYVDAEIDQAISGVQSQISYIIQNTDPAALDSLVEVVNAFQQADANLNGAITSLSTNLQNQINSLDTRIVSLETSVTDINQSITDLEEQVGDNLQQAIADIELSISAEQTARIAADTALSGRLDTLELDPVTKTYVDTQDLSSITQATNSAKSYTDLAVEAEKIRAEAAELVLSNAVTAEQQLRISGDADTLQSAKNYTDAQIAAIPPVDLTSYASIDYVDTEIDQAVTSLQSQISYITQNTDPAAIDSLFEVVTAFQEADQNLNGAITNLSTALSQQISNLDSELNQEKLDRASGDTALDTRITALEDQVGDDLQAAITSLQASIAAEEARALAAELVLQNNIDIEASLRSTADTALDMKADALKLFVGQVGSENFQPHVGAVHSQPATNVKQAIQYLDEAIVVVEGDLAQEIIDRGAAVSGVQSSLTQEISDRQAADSALDSRITDLEEQVGENLQAAISQIQLDISAEATTRASADAALQANITNVESNLSQEIIDRIAGDNLLQVNITNVESDLVEETNSRVAGDQLLQSAIDAEVVRATASEANLQNQLNALTTDDVAEASNLYYTDQRVQTKLANLSGNIVPDTDEAYDLGSPTNKFRDLYLSGFTLHLGGLTLSSNQSAGLVVRDSASELAINSDNIKEGTLNKFFTESRVQDSKLSSLDVNKSGDIVSTDSLIDGFSKLQNSITSEIARAQNAESILEASIENEEAARISGDQHLQNQITNILSNIDPAALDSLAEIVATLQNSEANINTAISNLTQQVNQGLASETQNREDADTALQQQINLANSDIDSLQSLVSTQEQEIVNLKKRVLELEMDQDDSLFNIEKITIQSQQDLNYVDLEYKAIPNSIVASIDRLMIYLNDDFEVSEANNVTRITWIGPLNFITGDEKIGLGDILKINYKISNSVFDSAPTPLILDDGIPFTLDDGDQLIF